MTLLLFTASAFAQVVPQRLPKPDFDSGYKAPPMSVPPPRAAFMEIVDVALLAAALGLAYWLVAKRRSRRGVVALSVFSLVWFGFVRGGCVCPVGSIQNVTVALADASAALPLAVAAFFFLPLIFALWGGRVFCGGVCPFGALQDLLLLRPVRVWPWVDAALGVVPLVYLGVVVLFAATGSAFLICRLDPFVTLFRLGGETRMVVYTAAVLLLGTFLARPYCRYFCPYGVPLAWLSRFAVRRPTVAPDACIQCRLCEDACPVGQIRRPTPESNPEPARSGVRRVGILLAVVPLAALAGGWSVSRLDAFFAGMHPEVRLAEQVRLENAGKAAGTTVESRAFRNTKTTPSELESRATAIQRRFRTGGWIVGAILGLLLSARLVAFAIHRRRVDYLPDSAGCLRCGRCYGYCPQEQAALRAEPAVGGSAEVSNARAGEDAAEEKVGAESKTETPPGPGPTAHETGKQ